MKRILSFELVYVALFLLYSAFSAPKAGYQIGDKAMIFSLKNVDNKTVSLGDNASAKGFIVVFTCNTCPVAQAYEDRILALNQQFAAKGYPVIAINANDATVSPGDSFDQMKKRAKDKDYKLSYLIDETQEVAKTYGARNTPTTYVVKRVGSDFIVSYIGAIDNSQDASSVTEKYVQNAVNELLANKPVAVPTAKAIGCGIKWKRA